MKALTLIFLFPVLANASWFCDKNASDRDGMTIKACGIGAGKDENEARAIAFTNAKSEFMRICKDSGSCKDKEFEIIPKRTECELINDAFTCKRLVVFEITDRPRAKPLEKGFEPFHYEDDSLPKVKVGMSKRELLESFGAPTFINYRGHLYFFGKMCAHHLSCSVALEKDKVMSFRGFKPAYTDYLN